MKQRRNRKRYPNPYLPIGTKVKSRYAARWTGIVEIIWTDYGGCSNHNVVRCRITHDRYGKPMRKAFLSMPLDTYWLEVIPNE